MSKLNKTVVQLQGLQWESWEAAMYQKLLDDDNVKVIWTAEELLNDVEVDRVYSVGFQVLMTIISVDEDRQGFLAEFSDEGDIAHLTKEMIEKNFQSQRNKPHFRYFPTRQIK